MKRTCRSLSPFVLAVLLVSMALPPAVLGQKDSGGITGVVRDCWSRHPRCQDQR